MKYYLWPIGLKIHNLGNLKNRYYKNVDTINVFSWVISVNELVEISKQEYDLFETYEDYTNGTKPGTTKLVMPDDIKALDGLDHKRVEWCTNELNKVLEKASLDGGLSNVKMWYDGTALVYQMELALEKHGQPSSVIKPMLYGAIGEVSLYDENIISEVKQSSKDVLKLAYDGLTPHYQQLADKSVFRAKVAGIDVFDLPSHTITPNVNPADLIGSGA